MTQPVCDRCWRMTEGERRPVRLVDRHPETCCLCGSSTTSGIYRRLDPSIVPYPTTRD